MKKFIFFASLVLALITTPVCTKAAGFTGDFSIVGGEITEEAPEEEEEVVTPDPTPVEEEEVVTPDPAPVEEVVTPDTTPVEEVVTPDPAPVEEVVTPDPTPVEEEEVVTPDPAPVEEVVTPDPAPVEEVVTPDPTPVEEEVAVVALDSTPVASARAISAEGVEGEIIIIEDEPVPGANYFPEPSAVEVQEDRAVFNYMPLLIIGIIVALFLLLLLNGIYVVEVKETEDDDFAMEKRFFSFSVAVDFILEANANYVQIRHLWRRSGSDIVYKFAYGCESTQYASKKEAEVLKQKLGFNVPDTVLA